MEGDNEGKTGFLPPKCLRPHHASLKGRIICAVHVNTFSITWALK